MNTKNNQRFQETQARIQKTLLHLLKEKDISKVTVRAICEGADINRSTFYAHYVDLPDLIKQTGKEMMLDIAELFRTTDNIMNFFLSKPYLTQMIEYVGEHRDFFDAYFNHCGRDAADESFILFWEACGKPYIKNLGLTNESEMWYHFVFFRAGFLAVLGEWLANNCPETPEQVATIILRNLPMTLD